MYARLAEDGWYHVITNVRAPEVIFKILLKIILEEWNALLQACSMEVLWSIVL